MANSQLINPVSLTLSVCYSHLPTCLKTATFFLLQKINRLYRPTFACQVHHRSPRLGGRPESRGRRNRNRGLGVVLTNYTSRSQNSDRANNDPPPKYTPPPSYSTATGARFDNFFLIFYIGGF